MIELKSVSKSYASIQALQEVSLTVKKGEFVLLVGPSGAGKSTLIRLLIREELPTSGQLLVAGRDITTLSRRELPYYRRKIGVIFQDYKLLPHKSVYENVAYALEVSDADPGEIKRKVPLILRIVGLLDRQHNRPDELSGGERQRVSIARALVHSPKILIADEPTGNLDPVNTWEIIDLLFRIHQEGTLVLLATHDKEIVDSLKKRVITMRGGQVIADHNPGKYLL